MIEAVGLVKTFGDFTAVRGVSLHVPEGQILALLGHNGAGKTTTTRMLAAILAPTEGYARIAGYDTVTQALEVRRIIGHLTELPGLYNRMRVVEYLDFFGELQGVPKKLRQERIEEMLQRFDLWETRRLRIGEYSKGMRQKTALIRALIHNPKVLFLDEPTNDFDVETLAVLEDYLDEFNGVVITVSHDRYFLDRVSEKIFSFEGNEKIIQFVGNYSEYKEYIEKNAELLSDGVIEIKEDKANIKEFKKSDNEEKGKPLKFTYKEQKEYEEIDSIIEQKEIELQEIDKKINAGSSDFEYLQKLVQEQKNAQDEIEHLMGRWTYLNELDERIEAVKNN